MLPPFDITLPILPLIAVLLLSYGLGSIPFGLVLTRMAGLGDIRKIGSGNIGATNVLRTGRRGLAALTLICDIGKGAAALFLTKIYFTTIMPTPEWEAGLIHNLAILSGVAAVLGHNFPIWLKFKGGKGVATTLGTLLALHWPLGLACIALWIATAAISRISSLSALVGLAAAPIISWLLGWQDIFLFAAFLAALGWARHHQNIGRLLKGQEPRFSLQKKD